MHRRLVEAAASVSRQQHRPYGTLALQNQDHREGRCLYLPASVAFQQSGVDDVSGAVDGIDERFVVPNADAVHDPERAAVELPIRRL